jgi:DNA-directed RNA polymerase subunit H (RpoH/RPB5)
MFGSNSYDNGVIYPLLRCMRILTHRQKINLIEYYEAAKSTLHTIYVDDLFAKQLNGKVGDIICITTNKNNVYRLIVSY